MRFDIELVNKIAVGQALPYEEVKQTRYGVLCTTSLGGHLSWFETGGSRWFAKPVKALGVMRLGILTVPKASRFLIKMAEEIEAVQSQSVQDMEGRNKDDSFPVFEPMRRKLLIHVEP